MEKDLIFWYTVYAAISIVAISFSIAMCIAQGSGLGLLRVEKSQ